MSYLYCLCGPLRDLRSSNLFLDVSLLAKDTKEVIRAHRLVLAAASPFFRDILISTGNANPTLRLPNVTAKELNNILDFVYTGEVQVQRNELNRFMAVARELQIKILTQSEEEEEELGPKKKKRRVGKDTEETVGVVEVVSKKRRRRVVKDAEVEPEVEETDAAVSVPKAKRRRSENSAVGYPCEYCRRLLKTRYSLKQHERDLHTDAGVKYRCPSCLRVYKSRNSMEVHLHNKHKEELRGIDIASCVLKEEEEEENGDGVS